MSEIPFVNQLGDALDAAIARPARTPRRFRLGRRRHLAVALAALTVAGGGAALADRLTDPAELGLGGIACYSGPGKSGDVAIVGLGDPGRSPLDICADAMSSEGLTESDLIACSEGTGIVVLRRERGSGCRAMGFTPVPAAYAPSRERVASLRDRAVALEERAGCVPPRELARRLRTVLRAASWAGWRAVIRGGEGPCGRVSGIGGSDARTLTHLNPGPRTLGVYGGMSLKLEHVLFGSESAGVRLIDSSGERCFTLAELEDHARRVLAEARLPISFRVRRVPANQGVMPPRGDLYERGCAVSAGPFPIFREGRTEVGVDIYYKG
jgi:hypothetical protein